MFKRIAVTILVLALTGNCFAQVGVALFDAEGDRIGQIFDAPAGSFFVLMTSDGYLIRIGLHDGFLDQPFGSKEDIFYTDLDCEGQAYITAINAGGWTRVGAIYQVGNSIKYDTFIRTEWALGATLASVNSKRKFTNVTNGTCENFLEPSETDFVPVTHIDYNKYGINFIPENDDHDAGYGYPTPITSSVEKPDGLFCNGFESCPAKE